MFSTHVREKLKKQYIIVMIIKKVFIRDVQSFEVKLCG